MKARSPGVKLAPAGITARELLEEYAGGMRGDRPLKAVIPGGASTPMLTPERLDIPMDFESLVEAGSMLGTGAIVVMEEGTCMVEVARRLMDFFAHESCGKCFTCREGTQRIYEILDEVREEVAVIRPPAWNRFAHAFSHIFAGGYAAGYYSYKWAEVLSADAFSAFEESGIFSTETGSRFMNTILAQGGSREPMELFVEFRGREPSIDALLRHSGLAA